MLELYGTHGFLPPPPRHGALSLSRESSRRPRVDPARRSSRFRSGARPPAAGRAVPSSNSFAASASRVLPNTAGCHSISEAVLTAKMARDLFGTNWIKLELIGHHDTLQPDLFQLVEAARILSADGFEVFPYTTDDLVAGERLLAAGCKVLMPWCAPIGTAAGPQNVSGLRAMRAEFPDIPLIVDAGIGRPSHAAARDGTRFRRRPPQYRRCRRR